MTTQDTVATLVEQLSVQTSDEGQTGLPLLVQLRRAVWGDIGQTMNGASTVNIVPINAGAYDLWKDITDGIAGLYSSATGSAATRSAVVNLLAWSAAFGAAKDRDELTDDMVGVALTRLAKWVADIRDQLMRLLYVPIRNFACPNCGESRAEWGVGELKVQGDAILITLENNQLVARCRNPRCVDLEGNRSEWEGDTEVTYMARRGGIDVDRLAEAIREARRPQPELPYNPDNGKTIREPFDPGNPEHAELRKVLP